MVGRPGHPLTKIGFRRDVRLFLTVLGGFFVVLVIALAFVLQSAMAQAAEAQWQLWNATADRAADDVGTAIANGGTVSIILTALRSRYGVSAVELTGTHGRLAEGTPPHETAKLSRPTAAGKLTLTWDAAPLASLQRRLFLTALISVVAAAIGLVLLLLYIPKITQPIEQMLDHAGEIGTREAGVDEQEFLIETFKTSIATLKTQQEQLRQLHDVQKLRADEFERVTAALTRSLTSGLIAIDAHGRVADVNQAGRDILRTAAAPAGLSIREALGGGALAELLESAVDEHSILTRREVRTRVGGGDEIVAGVTTVPLINEENVYLGMLVLFTDLTDIRRLESRIRDLQSLADLGELSAAIAHEFRNSLATILGYLRLAQRQSTADEIRSKIQRAEDEAAALGSAIESLLNLARPMTVDAHPTELREVVDDIVSRLETYAQGIAVNIDGNATVLADRTLLGRAIENVFRNAVDAVRESGIDGQIDFVITADPPAVRIADTGVGIDPDAASRIFLPFQSRKAHGLGIGLPLARKIVLLHGGTIGVAPAETGGTVVTMEFPAPGHKESADERPHWDSPHSRVSS
jgi:signal transduction histidine kinase